MYGDNPRSTAQIGGHPVHPMLIVFPLGLLGMSLLFDILYLSTGGDHWSLVSYYMIAAGIISGLVAAPFGLIDVRSDGSGILEAKSPVDPGLGRGRQHTMAYRCRSNPTQGT